MDPLRELLRATFQAAVQASQPDRVLANLTLPEVRGRTVLVSVGKAAPGMAAAVMGQLHGPVSGVVVAPHAQATGSLPGLHVLGAGHPTPDEGSVRAGAAVLDAVRALSPDDLLLCLISGGASALLCAPAGVTLDQKADLTRQLLASGASIQQINVVRKHLSRVKGGQLARAAAPARVVSLVLSDVVGDDLSSIASGPTAPDPSSDRDALAVLEAFGLRAPEARVWLTEGAAGLHPDTPKPDDPLFERVTHRIVGRNRTALEAAAAHLQQAGWPARIWRDDVTGPAREAARQHAQLARELDPGEALLSGGETTTVVRPGAGRGGRNLEFLLALALEDTGVYALAADSDGLDGSSDAAGAILTPDTLARAARLGLDARASLDGSDAHGFFGRLGDLIRCGPTGTNVNDVRCLLRAPS
ncbi:glycerate kinase type-2 family protein [Deinococcus sonorensis]|uniref:DUF4147 domain-containing protein n=2 Tax=Deinococcus sonorensis TaxID=309891 RepID=A0AAU7UFR1_9DEIO